MSFLSHPPWLDHSNYTLRRVQVMNFQIMQFSPTSTPSLLGLDINTQFSNTLSLCSSLNVRDQVSHPNRTTGQIIVFQSTGRKYIPTPLCLPQIPLDQTRARTRAAAVGFQRLTAWAMARPWSSSLCRFLLFSLSYLPPRTSWPHTFFIEASVSMCERPAVRSTQSI
jgi:hypothetical protein